MGSAHGWFWVSNWSSAQVYPGVDDADDPFLPVLIHLAVPVRLSWQCWRVDTKSVQLALHSLPSRLLYECSRLSFCMTCLSLLIICPSLDCYGIQRCSARVEWVDSGRPSLQALPLEASAWFSWWHGRKVKPAVQKGPEDCNLTRGLLSILTDVPSIDRYFSFSFAPGPH